MGETEAWGLNTLECMAFIPMSFKLSETCGNHRTSALGHDPSSICPEVLSIAAFRNVLYAGA